MKVIFYHVIMECSVVLFSLSFSVSLSLPLSLRSTLSYNKGLTLWLQKYWAMLVKRMYTSVRFWQAMVTQLILPLMFVLYAMVLAKTILFADNASDPKRRLSLRNSGLSSNRTFFWAEFDGASVGNYLTTNTSSFFDFTNEVFSMCIVVHVSLHIIMSSAFNDMLIFLSTYFAAIVITIRTFILSFSL